MERFLRNYYMVILISVVGLYVAERIYMSKWQLDQGQALFGPALVEARCSGCHEPVDGGGLYRIHNIRKSPEGWDMTLARMTIWHGVELPYAECQAIVKYLADTLGLAPEETAPYRWALEQDYNRVEDIPEDGDIANMCARCHSFARVALQRRDADEWRRLAATHLGQMPTIEHQEKGRAVNWWEIARDQTPLVLESLFPFETEAWDRWQAAPKPDPSGKWRTSGSHAGRRYSGHVEVRAIGTDRYSSHWVADYADGARYEGNTTAWVYTGYEWRGSSWHGDERMSEVFSISEDGDSVSGRWFPADSGELGASIQMTRIVPGESGIVAVEPPYIRTGEQAEIKIHGFGLSGAVDLGDGIEIVEVVAEGDATVTVIAKAASDAVEGARTVGVGEASGDGALMVYYNIDTVRVLPGEAIARIGGGGGQLAKVPAQFHAVAYVNGVDGQAGTEDDVVIGSMPATWAVENFNEAAERDRDADFAGGISDSGLFTPADAGINPDRESHGLTTMNNTGNLRIVGTIDDGGRGVAGAAHLVVTVQRFNTPPIR